MARSLLVTGRDDEVEGTLGASASKTSSFSVTVMIPITIQAMSILSGIVEGGVSPCFYARVWVLEKEAVSGTTTLKTISDAATDIP